MRAAMFRIGLGLLALGERKRLPPGVWSVLTEGGPMSWFAIGWLQAAPPSRSTAPVSVVATGGTIWVSVPAGSNIITRMADRRGATESAASW